MKNETKPMSETEQSYEEKVWCLVGSELDGLRTQGYSKLSIRRVTAALRMSNSSYASIKRAPAGTRSSTSGCWGCCTAGVTGSVSGGPGCCWASPSSAATRRWSG